MSSGEKMWPQKYGFKIIGNGPTFIVSIDRGSEAEESGLVLGDRLMELDGYDISRLSADVLTILMKETNGHPPAVGVVPNVCPVYLTCKKAQRCGFSVTTKKPITVSHLEPTGMAFVAGLRKGDILLSANDKPISEFGHKDLVLIAERESLVLSTIPTGIRENTITDDFRGPQINTSKFLFTKVAKYCGKDYHKKMALVVALTDYSEDWDIHCLCTSLDNLLKEPSDRKLLKHIEPFIPRHQKDIFKPLLKRKKLYKDCQHLAYIPNKPAQKLNFQILRGNNPYGLVMKGSCPVHVEWLDSAGPADLAGLVAGDFIVAVNEVDTKNFTHEQMKNLLQFCGPVPTIEVERYADVISEVGMNSSFDTWSSLSSTFSAESFNWICNEFRNVTDVDGSTFEEKMEYLLTPRERTELQMDFLQYVNSSNIVKLYHKLESILDSPSRRTLWPFLLTKMSKSHQEYINLKENLSATLHSKSTKSLLEYYLSCREETKMKYALDHYLKNRNFEQVRIMERILNTPAKKELWKSIVPHVIPEHLEIIQKQREEQRKIFAKFSKGIGQKNSSNTYLPPPSSESNEGNDSEEEFKLLEAAVQAVHVSNDLPPSDLSSEDGSINGRKTLSEAPGFHGPSGITHNAPVPIYKSAEDEPPGTAIPLEGNNDNNSSGVPEKLNYDTPMRTEELKKTSARTSAFHPYQKDVPQNEHVTVIEKIKELEAQKNIPNPPPIPPAPPLPDDKNDVPTVGSVKKLHWEKIERNPAPGTIWDKSPNEDIQDILPLLKLDTNFGSKKAKAQPTTEKKKQVAILVPKKAYNICILLAHLKLSVSDIKKAILQVDQSVLTMQLLQQLLSYAPNEAEIQEYESFAGKTEDLNQADRFSYEMIQIPNYKDRIEALVFKANFTEQAEELKIIIANLKSASLELQKSELLANILQLILAMGNYLNRGNERISGASGFRISFLTQIENTKTSDNKTTFLHVLADAVVKKFPDSPSLKTELSSVLKVAKVSSTDVTIEIEELASSQKNITNIIEGIKVCDSSDKIQEIMTNFLVHTKETIESLSDSLDEALKEFQAMLHYFGEEDKNTNTQKVFEIFATFINKFEKSRREISMNLYP